MKELFNLQGKVAIVTGVNGGIGLGISRVGLGTTVNIQISQLSSW